MVNSLMIRLTISVATAKPVRYAPVLVNVEFEPSSVVGR